MIQLQGLTKSFGERVLRIGIDVQANKVVALQEEKFVWRLPPAPDNVSCHKTHTRK